MRVTFTISFVVLLVVLTFLGNENNDADKAYISKKGRAIAAVSETKESRSGDSRVMAMRENIDAAAELFKIADDISSGVMNVDESSLAMARRLIHIRDGHVKKAALIVLSFGTVSKGSFESILSGVINYHDAFLVKIALAELLRYKDQQYFGELYPKLEEVLMSGSLLVREAVAGMMHLYINKKNYNHYKKFVNQLDENSKERVLLEASLERFRLEVSGS